MSSVTTERQLHPTGVAALLADLQNLSAEFASGGVVADIADKVGSTLNVSDAEQAKFYEHTLKTIFLALPGYHIHSVDVKDVPMDVSLMLSVYGAVSAKLPVYGRAHVIDADVQAGKLAVFGDTRSAMAKFADRIKEAVTSLADRSSRADEEAGVPMDDVAAAAVRTVKTYTEMVENGELTISNDRGLAIFKTMSKIKATLDLFSQEGSWIDHVVWSPENVEVLRTFDDTMENFQAAVVSRLAVQLVDIAGSTRPGV